MSVGVQWLTDNNNNVVPGVSGWATWNADTYFSNPEEIGIVITQLVNVSTKTNYLWGVRHPDEVLSNTANISLSCKSVLFIGAKDTGVAGARCQVATYRNGAANQYGNRVYGGIRRGSCEWKDEGASFTASTIGWQEVDVYSYSPPSDATCAILEILAPGGNFGVRHPSDSTSIYYETMTSIAHFLAPIRWDSTSSCKIEVYSNTGTHTVYIRGWIKNTNPGIVCKNPIQDITATTTATNRDISQVGYKVTGGFFVVKNTSTAYYCRVINPNWTILDEYDVNDCMTQACSCNSSSQIQNKVENTAVTMGLIAFSTGYQDWPHDIGGVENPNIGKIGGVAIGNIEKVGGVGKGP